MRPLKKPRQDSAESVLPTGPDKAAVSTTAEHASRNLRQSTQEISRGFRQRLEEKQQLRKRRRRRGNLRDQDRKMSQEELLEEARWTEIENLASLDAYTKMEEERKKVKVKKKPWTGPVVRFLSLTMPLVTDGDVVAGPGAGEKGPGLEGTTGGEKEVGLDGEQVGPLGPIGGGETKEVRFLGSSDKMDSSQLSVSDTSSHTPSSVLDLSMSSRASPSQADKPDVGSEHASSEDATALALPTGSIQLPTQKTQPETLRQSRNFLIFTDTSKYPSEYFPSVRLQKPKRRLCPVTRLPAKYIDPLTRTPYATPFAFKVIRTRYVNEAEQKCEQRLLQLSNWLEEKKKKKMEVS